MNKVIQKETEERIQFGKKYQQSVLEKNKNDQFKQKDQFEKKKSEQAFWTQLGKISLI